MRVQKQKIDAADKPHKDDTQNASYACPFSLRQM